MTENKVEINKELLEGIMHELVSINQWYAFEPLKYNKINMEEGHILIDNNKCLVELDYSELIKRIDEVLRE